MDLHAMTLEMALLRTEEFIKRCQLKKMHKVLIIHGKGSGVLKEGVRRYLAQHPGVIQIEDAERQQGGSGAVRVTLRR
jgi:DNA mismatch repair protein MutS2